MTRNVGRSGMEVEAADDIPLQVQNSELHFGVGFLSSVSTTPSVQRLLLS